MFLLVLLSCCALLEAALAPASSSSEEASGTASKDLYQLLECCEEGQVRDNRTVVELGYLAAVKGKLHNR